MAENIGQRGSSMINQQIKISASMMCTDFYCLEDVLFELKQAKVDALHFDIMDGHFVPNITLGPDFVRSLRGKTDLPFDIHLMVQNPDNYLDIFAEVGSNIIIFHTESCVYPFRTIKQIRAHGLKVGVALNPATSLSAVEYILDQVDLVLIMTVEPGFAGQDFISSMVYKVRALRDIIFQRKIEIKIEVDGHIDKNTIPALAKAGANIFVGGSSGLFTPGLSIAEAVKVMRDSALIRFGY